MEVVEKKISSLIDNQFPSFMRSETPLFVAFVRHYYKWLESQFPAADSNISLNGTISVAAKNAVVEGNQTNLNTYFKDNDYIAIYTDNEKSDYDILKIKEVVNNTSLILDDTTLPALTLNNVPFATVSNKNNALYWSRRLLDNQDIDLCDDEVLLFFKEKYLKDIKIDTLVDIRRLIKYSLDLYRSKGTERSVDLLYKAVFGKPAKVYHPSKDIFTTSSGKWYRPRYLELSLNSINKTFINKQIQGKISGARAFVDSVVRKNINGKLRDIAYISSINGDFVYGEKIVDDITPIDLCPLNIGSLRSIDIDVYGTGSNFEVGDTVNIYSNHGTGARGRVSQVSNVTGLIDYSLTNRGYGYTANAEVIVSDTVLTVNVVTNEEEYFKKNETLIQPIANIQFANANGSFFIGSNIYTYHGNNDLKGLGQILHVNQTNTSAGYLVSSIITGDLNDSFIYTESNTVGANVSLFNDLTAEGTIVGLHSNVVLSVSNVNLPNFEIGQELYQAETNSSGIIRGVFYKDELKTTADITLSNVSGPFFTNTVSQNSTSGIVDGVQVSVGVVTQNNEFMLMQNNIIVPGESNTTGTIIDSNPGSANIVITSFMYPEEISVALDKIEDYANVTIDASEYGFPANPTGNGSTPMEELFGYDDYTIHAIGSIHVQFADSGLLKHPIISVSDPHIAPLNRPSTVIINVANVTGSFIPGDLIYQPQTNARGIIIQSNTTTIVVQNMRYSYQNQFIQTTNSSTLLFSEQTGASATINQSHFSDMSILGNDATINSRFVQSEGAITGIEIIDTGYGFINGEEVVIVKDNNFGIGYAKLNKHGIASGYYRSRDGFLSSNKKLFDGVYYQPYSYEVQSAVINNYKEELKDITHVAGTKYFDKIVYDAELEATTDIRTKISISNE